ncbi:unnamed protein product [Linum tenue]|jgi:hypothetical protein
MHRS